MEVVWVPLEGQAGTGQTLDAAMEEPVTSSGLITSEGLSPLRRERDGHSRAAAAAAAAGRPPPTFEAWVLWEDNGTDPAATSPVAASQRRSYGNSGGFSPTAATASLMLQGEPR
jgi:hypothetical protein